MRRIIPLFLVLALLCTPASAAFWDVSEGAWYAPAAAYVEKAGLMQGVPGGAFAPGLVGDRGTIATVLHRSVGTPQSFAPLDFVDVEYGGPWSLNAILWCDDKGVVTGVEETRFYPYDPVTREQAALMLWRLAGWPQSGTSYFWDGAQINLWAKAGVDWAWNAGIVKGKGDGGFHPQDTITRAELAQMMMNFSVWKSWQG